MIVIRALIKTLVLFITLAGLVTAPSNAFSSHNFDNSALRGTFVLSMNGTFVSAPPPFTGAALPFAASQVGRLTFDGAGLANGEVTLVFHNPNIPFNVTSRFELRGAYEVSANGKVVISLDEFPLDMNGDPVANRSNSMVLECYIVRRSTLRCVLHTLISYQQGPEPRNLPVTMSGLLQRQR